MKTLFIAIGMMTTVCCMSQKSIPPAVQAAFTKAYPGISVKKWDKEDGKFEANFMKDGKSMSVTYDANGSLEETEVNMAVEELSANIISYIKEHYEGATIKEAAMITKPNGDMMYEAEIKGKDLLFDMQGKFLKEEME